MATEGVSGSLQKPKWFQPRISVGTCMISNLTKLCQYMSPPCQFNIIKMCVKSEAGCINEQT